MVAGRWSRVGCGLGLSCRLDSRTSEGHRHQLAARSTDGLDSHMDHRARFSSRARPAMGTKGSSVQVDGAGRRATAATATAG